MQAMVLSTTSSLQRIVLSPMQLWFDDQATQSPASHASHKADIRIYHHTISSELILPQTLRRLSFAQRLHRFVIATMALVPRLAQNKSVEPCWRCNGSKKLKF